MDGPWSARALIGVLANLSGAVMYTAFVCGHERPLALMEVADRAPIIATRSKRDDATAFPDLDSRPFAITPSLPFPTT
jgi:hypothetical protein